MNINRKLLIVGYTYDDEEQENKLIDKYILTHLWAKACSEYKVDVTIFQRYSKDSYLERDGVRYFFVSDGGGILTGPLQVRRKFNTIIRNYVSQLAINASDIAIHIDGMIFPASIAHLKSITSMDVLFCVQNHAEGPGGIIKNYLYKYCLKGIDKAFFTTHFHADSWIKRHIIHESKICQLMECTSACVPENKIVAKRELGYIDRILILWTGNLNSNKDPITVLKGFEKFSRSYPGARLLMLFREQALLSQVTEYINALDIVRSVKLIGEVPYSDISRYYSAADIFVQGSHHEGSGIAVLDAMCCGAIPVVTHIPSFKEIVKDGGYLWRCSDSMDFTRKLFQAMDGDMTSKQKKCKEIFQSNWDQRALAAKALSYYFPKLGLYCESA